MEIIAATLFNMVVVSQLTKWQLHKGKGVHILLKTLPTRVKGTVVIFLFNFD